MKNTINQVVKKTPPYPEVLPWFARRAGISEPRAKALWDLTCQELPATHLAPADLAKARMDQFIERIGAEAGLPITPDYSEQPDKFAWLCRHYARLTDMALVSSGAFARFWQQAMSPAVK
ncbi:MAG: hypothetical protein ACOYBR_00510 [Fluviibacter sp.]